MFILVEGEGIIHPHGQEHFSVVRGQVKFLSLAWVSDCLDWMWLTCSFDPSKTPSFTSSLSRRVESTTLIIICTEVCCYRKIINRIMWYIPTQSGVTCTSLIVFLITAGPEVIYSSSSTILQTITDFNLWNGMTGRSPKMLIIIFNVASARQPSP